MKKWIHSARAGLIALLLASALAGCGVQGSARELADAGKTALDQQDYGTAVEDLQKALEESSGWTTRNFRKNTLLYLAEAQVRSGDFTGAQTSVNQVMGIEGKKAEYRKLQAEICNEAAIAAADGHDLEQAASWLEQGMNFADEKPVKKKKEEETARPTIRETLIRNLASVKEKQGDYSRAAELLQTCIDTWGEDEALRHEKIFVESRIAEKGEEAQ